MTQLIDGTQFLEYMAALKWSKKGKLSAEENGFISLERASWRCIKKNQTNKQTRINDSGSDLCREKDKLLGRNVVLLNHHRGIGDGDQFLVERSENLGRPFIVESTESPRVSVNI